MVDIVFKAAPEVDLYCVWTTEYDRPVRVANRAGMLAYLREHTDTSYALNSPEGRLARADATGTSAVGGFLFFGAWDDEGITVEQRGWLPRADLAVFLGLYFGDAEPAYKLLKPFEGE